MLSLYEGEPMKDKRACKACVGYGWYPIGDLTPIGKMDSKDWGKHVIKCPWCGAGYAEGEKYDLLVKHKKGIKETKQ